MIKCLHSIDAEETALYNLVIKKLLKKHYGNKKRNNPRRCS